VTIAVAIRALKQVYEHTQIIATAIGKPATMAPKIVRVNARSRFSSRRTLSTDMSLTPPHGINRNPDAGTKPIPVPACKKFKEVMCDRARTWLTNG
jgi:hypothetical protein